MVEAIIVKKLEEMPINATLWSRRSMAHETGMKQAAIPVSGGRSV
jgi:hypothetical protein